MLRRNISFLKTVASMPQVPAYAHISYSVFKKEGNKVNAYYTNKKRHFGSTMRFFPTTT